MILRSPLSSLFPYTTLFRSRDELRLLHDLRGRGIRRGRSHAAIRSVAQSFDGQRQSVGLPSVHPRHQRKSASRSEEHTSELQSRRELVCRLLLEKKKIPAHH